MNVLFITNDYTTHDRRFLDVLLKSDNIQHIFYHSFNRKINNKCTLFEHSKITYCQELSDVLDKEKLIDIIHMGPISIKCADMVLFMKKPVVLMSWASDILVQFDLLEIESKKKVFDLIVMANSIIVDCACVRQKILAIASSQMGNIFEFPWGLNLDDYDCSFSSSDIKVLREECKINLDDIVFISTRTWDVEYGVTELLVAFYKFSLCNKNAKLIVGSTGPLKEDVFLFVDKFDLKDKIYFTGQMRQQDILKWMNVADIYISSSFSDGSSISLMEALYCQLPVIVHNEYGNLDWIEDEKNGWLANCHDVDSILKSMERAVEKKKDWETIGKRNRELILKRGQWKNNSLKIFTAYENALSKYSPST